MMMMWLSQHKALGLGISAHVKMFSCDGILVLTTICSSTYSKQQLVDYQKVGKVLLDYWFQDLMGTFIGEQSKDEELMQATNLLRALDIRIIGSPD